VSLLATAGMMAMAVIAATLATAAVADAGGVRRAAARELEPITYVIRIPAPDTHEIVVQATVPASGRASLDLMMPTWSPGYYRVEDYAANVRDVAAETLGGQPLVIEKTNGNHWRVDTRGERAVKLSYRVFCNQRTVTTNYVDADYGVFNGAPTFITLAENAENAGNVENAKRPHDVRVELPPGWTAAMTGLDDAPGGRPNEFRATDYEMLVDSPIVAGKLGIRTFEVKGKQHFVVSAGDTDGWDGDRAARDLRTFVEENRRFWGFLPYEKYVFLLLFRPGGGGLEHRNSNLSTVVAKPRPRADGTPVPVSADARWPSLGLQAHEYFHLFNVKRLRPIELGPFNFEKAPTTGSLWISEGVTSYYSGLLMTRAGLQTVDEYLASLSSAIRNLQKSPGRLLQSVERSSLEVWENSNSGVNAKDTTVSYYIKGNVMGLLLDAKIRRATNGRASFDDVMRLAYRRYSGARGFTADEFRRTAEQIAGVDLRKWFESAVSSTDELDYTDVLEWYGLRFAASGAASGAASSAASSGASDSSAASAASGASGASGAWTLERRPDQTAEQRKRLATWLEK
jgi:predicted metalloprotease with PDZ domain